MLIHFKYKKLKIFRENNMTNPTSSGEKKVRTSKSSRENKVTAPESDRHQKVTAHIGIRVR